MNQTSALSPVTEDYGAAQIQILEGLEAVRKRPSTTWYMKSWTMPWMKLWQATAP